MWWKGEVSFRTRKYRSVCCRIILSGKAVTREVCSKEHEARFAVLTVARDMPGGFASNINTVSRIEEEGVRYVRVHAPTENTFNNGYQYGILRMGFSLVIQNIQSEMDTH